MSEAEVREYLFISYAWEDEALAQWLTLKLTAEGYKVWCDRYQLLGGETQTRDIDDVIKHRTFRMLGLVSRSSLRKPSPLGERDLALKLGRERGEDFLIPLNVDGLKPTDLDWTIGPLTYIPFKPSWQAGLSQLLKKLRAIAAPKPLSNGTEIAASAFLAKDVIEQIAESVYTNCLPAVRIPDTFVRLTLNRPLPRAVDDEILRRWTYYGTDTTTLLAFCPPPDLPAAIKIVASEFVSWCAADDHETQQRYLDVVSGLISRGLERRCLELGLVRNPWSRRLYFPRGLLKGDTLPFRGYLPKATRLKVAGERHFGPALYRYHLSPSFRMRRDVTPGFVVQLKVGLYLTDGRGRRLTARSLNARRKRMVRDWWNHEWLSRQLAMCEFLADHGPEIFVGGTEEQIVISAAPLSGEVPLRIDEAAVKRFRDGIGVPPEGEKASNG